MAVYVYRSELFSVCPAVPLYWRATPTEFRFCCG